MTITTSAEQSSTLKFSQTRTSGSVIHEIMTAKKKPHLWLKILKDGLLIIFVILAVAIGVVVGLSLRNVWSYEDYRKIFYLEFPGRLLLNMLQMLILPLVVSSLITALTSVENNTSGKLAVATLLYYMSTTFTACLIGVFLVLVCHPGTADDRRLIKKEDSTITVSPIISILDLISQCFPENIIAACFQRVSTQLAIVKSEPRLNVTSNTTYTVDLVKPRLITQSGTNILGIVVFSIAMGAVINHLGEEGLPLKHFFQALNSVTMVLIAVAMWYTPVGVAFIIASKFISTKDIVGVVSDLGKYMAVVLVGLAIHGFIVLPLIYFFATRKNPLRFAFNMLKALFTAWATASSSATLPVTIDCLINKNKVNPIIVGFMVPIGATVNMNGTALYQAVASIFIAQVNGMHLSVADIIIVSLTSSAVAVGAAGVPQGDLITLVIVLTAVGLPTEDLSIILSIDWLLDRFRTVINVWGDCIGAGMFSHVFRRSFSKEGREEPYSGIFEDVHDQGSGRTSNTEAPIAIAWDQSESTKIHSEVNESTHL